MLLARHVVVDRGLGDAELLGEVAHAGGVVPLAVEQVDRRAQHGGLVVAGPPATGGTAGSLTSEDSHTGCARTLGRERGGGARRAHCSRHAVAGCGRAGAAACRGEPRRGPRPLDHGPARRRSAPVGDTSPPQLGAAHGPARGAGRCPSIWRVHLERRGPEGSRRPRSTWAAGCSSPRPTTAAGGSNNDLNIWTSASGPTPARSTGTPARCGSAPTPRWRSGALDRPGDPRRSVDIVTSGARRTWSTPTSSRAAPGRRAEPLQRRHPTRVGAVPAQLLVGTVLGPQFAPDGETHRRVASTSAGRPARARPVASTAVPRHPRAANVQDRLGRPSSTAATRWSPASPLSCTSRWSVSTMSSQSGDRVGDRLADQDLAALGERGHPGGLGDVAAEDVVVAVHHVAVVDADPDQHGGLALARPRSKACCIAIAQRTACSGAPNAAMKPSPWVLTTWPSYR